MGVTSLCLNVAIKVNLDYVDWRPLRLLPLTIARILMVDDFYWKY